MSFHQTYYVTNILNIYLLLYKQAKVLYHIAKNSNLHSSLFFQLLFGFLTANFGPFLR